VIWSAMLNDRVVGLTSNGTTTIAVTHDGSEVTLDAAGKPTKAQVIGEARVDEAAKALGGQADIDAASAKTFDLAHFIPKKLVKMDGIEFGGVPAACVERGLYVLRYVHVSGLLLCAWCGWHVRQPLRVSSVGVW